MLIIIFFSLIVLAGVNSYYHTRIRKLESDMVIAFSNDIKIINAMDINKKNKQYVLVDYDKFSVGIAHSYDMKGKPIYG